MERVVIIGGGGGGAILANLLPEEFKVTVVDKSEVHFFQPGNLWIAFKGVRKEKFLRPLRSLLKPRVEFVHDEVVSVDLNERVVKTASGKSLSYDYVVFASGAELDYGSVPGHRELLERFGDFYSTPENAEKLHASLRGLKEGRFVIGIADPVYKCPPGPHKAAFLSWEFFARRGLSDKVKVVLAVPVPHAYPSKTIADIIEPELNSRGIELHTFFTVNEVDVANKRIVSLEGEELSFDVAAVVPPHRGPSYAVNPAEVKDGSGYIKIDKYTSRVEGFDDAYAIGDCTNAPTSKSGVTAHLQAEVVAARLQGIDARYSGRTNCPLITDGKGLFVISDYDHPPIPVRLSKFKRLMEDFFVATYWSAVRSPELWSPIFRAYFEATDEFIRRGEGW
ncbi:NAD(P)/FAD-dependent oxidoreductase [Thermofilum pendens]|uniref:FAD-dependent pyridine nucleotide-disulphide oxidoreductase n=1 Tax=Thermofilum pendens (strain DSM 2475 / Hrk 5) TaxID=368408 RepID=A1S167_THEPD|nr:FAD/NAD(P)-binding oxidoreductase [Thermofilum pendens]ABL79197.1 FAD-dependent pyridine nucleotide-disulphide oxidoreductase [Thermofilum pendens Hrk 5]